MPDWLTYLAIISFSSELILLMRMYETYFFSLSFAVHVKMLYNTVIRAILNK